VFLRLVSHVVQSGAVDVAFLIGWYHGVTVFKFPTPPILSVSMTDVIARTYPVDAVSGIYAIEHTPSGKIYVGSSKNLRNRLLAHAHNINRKRHPNRRIRKASSVSRLSDFIAHLLLLVPATELLKHEGRIIRTTRAWPDGFNLSPYGTGTVPFQKRITAQQRATSRTFALRFEGKTYRGKNLRKFARDHNLSYSTINRVLNGKRIQYKGWTLPGTVMPQSKVIGPDGKVHLIPWNNKREFCRKHGIKIGLLRAVLESKNVMHDGWSHAEAKFKPEDRRKWDSSIGQFVSQTHLHYQQKPVRLMKDGVLYTGENRAAFAREHGESEQVIQAIMNGRIEWCRGWHLPGVTRPDRYLTDEHGNRHTIPYRKFSEFAKSHGLNLKSIRAVIKGTRPEYRGWKLTEPFQKAA
jgi:hypothetical protein